MHTSGLLRLTACAVMATATPALAAGTGGCDSFDWPLTTELAWVSARDPETAISDAKFAALPAKALAVTLLPVADVKFEIPPGGKPKNKPDDASGAVISFTGVPTPGIYQVSLSGPGWVDVVQGGKALPAVAHTGKSDCDRLRKSVRFDIKDGPFSIQLSDIPAPSMKITIRAAQ